MGKTYLKLILSTVLLSPPAFAGVTGYITPERNSSLDRDIYRAFTIAGMARLNRPYKVDDVRAAIELIKEREPALTARLNRELSNREALASADTIDASAYSADDVIRPNAKGAAGQEQFQLGAEAHWQGASWFRANGALSVGEQQQSLAGTLVSIGGGIAQLDIGFKPYWLSPLQGHSQLLSTQTESVPSISLSNPVVINSWGLRWNYEIAVAELSKQMTAFGRSFDDSKGPLLAIFHLSLQPADWWVLGATRNFQFGGGEREVSAKTLAKAFYDPRGSDNDASVDEESGNQVASLSSQMHFTAPWAFTFNIEFAGEDTSNNKEYQLGNPALSAGLYFPSFGVKGLGATFEYSEWDNGWYVNNVYQEGYSHEGYVLGHWAMQEQHDVSRAAPGQSQYIAFDYVFNDQHSAAIGLRTAEHQIGEWEQYQRLHAEYTWSPSRWQFSLGLTVGENSLGDTLDEAKFAIRWR